MISDVNPTVVRRNKNNRRVLVRRTLIAALILICAACAYSFFLVLQFHFAVVALQKNNAFLQSCYPNEQGQLVQVEYGMLPGRSLIPAPFRLYHHSLCCIYLRRPPAAQPAEIDRLFQLFAQFPKLQEIGLEGITLDEDRVNAISHLPALQTLTLKQCQIKTSCLESVLQINGLQQLSLAESDFPESALNVLTRGSTPETLLCLNLSYCKVTDQSASIISRLRNLETLVLDGTQISDLGLKQLARLPQLKVLILDHTNVTDAGVGYLSSTPNLVELSLSNTSVSDAMLETLKQEIPALRVSDD